MEGPVKSLGLDEVVDLLMQLLNEVSQFVQGFLGAQWVWLGHAIS